MRAALGFFISFGLVASTGRVINFDTFTIGKMPPGWTAAMTNPGSAAKWEILKDATAPTQPYVLAQVSHEPGNRTPLAIFDEMPLQDGGDRLLAARARRLADYDVAHRIRNGLQPESLGLRKHIAPGAFLIPRRARNRGQCLEVSPQRRGLEMFQDIRHCSHRSWCAFVEHAVA